MIERTRNRIRAVLLVAIALTMAPLAMAGLPQPGIVLYGQVKQGSTLLTQGTLEWTYTPTQGGAAVKVKTSLQDLPGPNNDQYSYSILIPTELRVQGFGQDPKVLGLYNDRQVEFLRSATLDGEALSINSSTLGEKFSLNAINHVGFVERVDLLVPRLGDCCTGDADLNLFVNINDYRAVRDAFGDSSPESGDADCNGFVNMKDYRSVRDNFGKQCGPAQSGVAIDPIHDDAGEHVKALPEGATPDAATLSISLSTAAAQKGEFIDVTLMMDPGSFQAGLTGVFLKFDAAKLKFVAGSVNNDVFTNSYLTGVPQEVAPRVIAFSAGSDVGVSNSVAVGSLLFEAIAEGEAAISYAVEYPMITQVQDLAWNDVTTHVTGRIVTVRTATTLTSSVDDFILY